MAVPTIYLFDRWDVRLGLLRPSGAVTHEEVLGGEDVLELDCLVAPAKGDRLLWRDPEDGTWREHEVVRTSEPLVGPCHVHAESSVCELLRDYVEEAQLVSRTAAQAMAAALAPTRWELGTVGVGDGKHGCLLYHTNALAALRRVEEVWEGELECSVTVDDVTGRVSSRTVSLLGRRGSWRGARLEYGRNMRSCTRTVLDDEVVTALYGWGKGLPITDEEGQATGGYTRRLSIADANGGQTWVGDDEARELWGRWDATRSERVHAFGDVVFPDCEDATELLALTRAELARVSQPRVSYQVEAAALSGATRVGLGDDVAVVDASRSPEWRLRARVVRRERTFGEGATRSRLTIGTAQREAWTESSDVAARVATAEDSATRAADAVSSVQSLDGEEF